MTPNILIVDDNSDVLSALKLLLKSEGYNPIAADSPEKALATFKQCDTDLILMDLNYSLDTTSGKEGLSLISAIRQQDELTPIIVMTGWGSIEVAVDTMKNGANDFVQKPWENDRLIAIIVNQLKFASAQKQSQLLSQQNQLLRQEVSPAEHLIVESDAIKQIMKTINQVAVSDASILLTGENGTGKSLFARVIHERSLRKQSTQISVNMGAVTESLFESEMFGHLKGAFTDAKSSRIGRFELADKSTLFLDEIANTPYSQQAKLLRVLEDLQFEKVGSSKTQTIDIRLISATNANLEDAVTQGEFRKDLFYRINTIEIEIPPLRKRLDDIVPLANSFLKKVALKYSKPMLSISQAAEKALKAYSWPGNVRELSHVMERAQILCQTDQIEVHDLGLTANSQTNENRTLESADLSNDLRPLSEIEADIILNRSDHFKGDANQTAKSLGLSRSAFYRKLEKLRD